MISNSNFPFKKVNAITAWVVFAIALVTYTLTLETSASLWDCGEFIATSYKLEVGHPPGTPFFFLINRLAAMFASGPDTVAWTINFMSGLESAFTIFFLYLSIVMLGQRIYEKNGAKPTATQLWSVIAAGVIGSLAYAFSDTFWFSAVEAEVYALSSLFTALVFWAMLKWERMADQPGANRWLVLIVYLMGLSIGAHVLNLLCIPALVFIYYFKKYPGRKHSDLWKPALASLLLLGIFYKITPIAVSIGAWFDRMFVNGFGFGVNSGLTFFVILLLGLIVWGIYKTQKNGKAGWNTIWVSAAMLVLGFSTYGVVLIRASANPPLNSNDPSNPYALLSFLNRDQYGDVPLLYGQSFASVPVGYKYSDSYYVEDGEYKPMRRLKGYKYDPATEMLFPRMRSTDPRHAAEYKRWVDFRGQRVRTDKGQSVVVPTQGENLRFFMSYQVNNMYWRYFLWNFAGRQSDLQNNSILDGNWLSGIGFIDEAMLGPQDNLPSEMAANRGHNTYYFLPLILGLLGFFFQLKRDGRGFLVTFLLFFMTGLAIILYLNQTPLEPRERDYAYAGSFYAFAIWLGLGLLQIYEWLARGVKARQGKIAVATAFVLCATVPVIMAAQNWDDHDRSGRTVARDFGYNYLSGLLPNAIILDYGDNDTFPLWYAQEVEGFRTDVRVMNTSYITGEWYIDQMRIQSHESAPVPHSMPRSKYIGERSGFPVTNINKKVAVQPHPWDDPENPGIPPINVAAMLSAANITDKDSPWTGEEVMRLFNNDKKETKLLVGQNSYADLIPSHKIAIPVDKEAVLRNGVVRPEDAHLIADTIYITLSQDQLNSGEMAVLDMLITNNWERPIYFTSPLGAIDYGLVKYTEKESWSYLQQDGIVYRFVPIKSPAPSRFEIGRIDVETLYDNLMNKYAYGHIAEPHVYVDQFVQNTFAATQLRSSFARLAGGLLEKGDTTRAVQVLDRAMAEMPLEKLRSDEMMPYIADAYLRAGATEKGTELLDKLGQIEAEYLDYFARLDLNKRDLVDSDRQEHLNVLYRLYLVAELNGYSDFMNAYRAYLGLRENESLLQEYIEESETGTTE